MKQNIPAEAVAVETREFLFSYNIFKLENNEIVKRGFSVVEFETSKNQMSKEEITDLMGQTLINFCINSEYNKTELDLQPLCISKFAH